MSYFHHNTIRSYVAAVLNIFNDIEIQYENSLNNTISKNIPIKYSSREKSRILDKHTNEQILSGNYNVLPRGSLSLTGMAKAIERATNKNLKITSYKSEDSMNYMFNSVPYEFAFDVVFQCRGMNEATQIIEQICPKFNPIVNVDVWDGAHLDEPTRIPVKLESVDIETDEYDELSTNIFTVVFGISIQGNLYPPIKTMERIKEFKIRMNEYNTDDYSYNRKSILSWDVNYSGETENPETLIITDPKAYPPIISDITSDSITVGNINLTAIYEDQDNTINELTFLWEVVSGIATIAGDKDNAILTVGTTGDYEIQLTITDPYGNYVSINKILTIV